MSRRLAPFNVYTSQFGVIVPRITGSISVCSSIALIYLIATSESRLRTVYHRLMLGVSISDIIASVAMALTSLPMPTHENVAHSYHDWENDNTTATRLGNIETCEAQGFCFTLGSIMSYSYIGALCFYYLCTIVFRMSQEKIQKKVEPFLHIVPIVLGLGVSVPFLFLDMYNQSDGLPWCTLIPLPNWCIPNGRISQICLRGVRKMISGAVVGTLVSVDCVVVTVSLFLVVRHVGKHHNIMKQYSKQRNKSIQEPLDPEVIRKCEIGLRALKVASIQSVAYIVCFVITLSFLIIGGAGVLVLLPLQGFFNFVIFAGSKVDVIRQANREVSLFGALRILFYSNNTADEDNDLINSFHFKQDEDGFVEPYSSSNFLVSNVENNTSINNTSSIEQGNDTKRDQTVSSRGGLSGFSSSAAPSVGNGPFGSYFSKAGLSGFSESAQSATNEESATKKEESYPTLM